MPHRPPMLMLDALLEHDETRVACDKTFREGDPFVQDGRVTAFVAIELFAQAAAAHFAYAGVVRGDVSASGALLGARKIELLVPSYAVGERLIVRAVQLGLMPPAAQYEGTIERGDGTVLARGTLSVAMTMGSGPPRE
jgi:predicted hotdog family 3-hydroxylacyl-ACP dehydratase